MAGLNGADRTGAVRVASAHASNGSPSMVVEAVPEGALVDGALEEASLKPMGPPRARLATRAGRHDVLVLPLPDARRATAGVQRLEIVVDGWRFELDVQAEARARLRERATRAQGDRARGGPFELRAIIPGRVISVDVAEGDAVEAGQRVLVVEAMKMQNELRAPRAGTIGRLGVGPGQTVELGDLLLVVE
jgi:biotin carboxyl carrier protein